MYRGYEREFMHNAWNFKITLPRQTPGRFTSVAGFQAPSECMDRAHKVLLEEKGVKRKKTGLKIQLRLIHSHRREWDWKEERGIEEESEPPKLFSSSFLPSSYVLDLVKSRVDVAQCLDGLLIISRSSEFVDCAVFPVDQSVLSFLYRRWKIDCWVPKRGKMRKWPPCGDRYRMQKWNIPR